MHNEYDENLLEPLKYYNNYLKGHFRKVTEDYFQELVDEAGFKFLVRLLCIFSQSLTLFPVKNESIKISALLF